MKFTEIKKSESDEKMHKEFFNIARAINRDCQPYLKQNKSALIKTPLYRGIQGTNPQLTIKKEVRLTNRKPVDTYPVIHEFYNKTFKEIYGSEFRNSVFVSGDINTAIDYGEGYIVFPIGDFEYIWSEIVGDLDPHTGYIISSVYRKSMAFLSDENIRDELKPGSELWNSLYHGIAETYQKDDLISGIKSGNEIMIRAKAYYGIHLSVLHTNLPKYLHKVIYK